MNLLSNSLQEKWLAGPTAISQTRLQMLLIVLIFGSLAVASWRYEHAVLMIGEARARSSRSVSSDGYVLNKNIQPLSFYSQLVEKRDIFSLSSLAATNASAAAVPQEVLLPASQDMMSRYIVQGIVHDGNPMAIIKDKQSNKTYFLHRSEILEGASLIDIRENHVIFDRGGEMMELIKK